MPSLQTRKITHEALHYGFQRGAYQATHDATPYSGRYITIDNETMLNFGNCSYMGLEMDGRVRQGAIDAINRNGTQFSTSRLYIQSDQYQELENIISDMYDLPCLVSPTTSLGHQANFQVLMGEGDVLVLDHQAHASIKNAVLFAKDNGAQSIMIRHNNLDMLMDVINQYKGDSRVKRIWYCIDGVYSMFGDLAPIPELYQLLNQCKKLWLYVDDAHGSGWYGKDGTGTTASHGMHAKMILTHSFAKAFASGGGYSVYPNDEMRHAVKTNGGAHVFSGPIQPAQLGAVTTVMKLLRSGELDEVKASLSNKIALMQSLLDFYCLPNISSGITSIFFVGTASVKTAMDLVDLMMSKGFYVNLSSYPLVPMGQSGVRFTITNLLENEDIHLFAKSLKESFVEVMEIHNGNRGSIIESFSHLNAKINDAELIRWKVQKNNLVVRKYRHIAEIGAHNWNQCFGDNVTMAYDWLQLAEKKLDADFIYYSIEDEGKVILRVLFSCFEAKTEMYMDKNLSEKANALRQNQVLTLNDKVLAMGTNISIGKQCWIDRSAKRWKQAVFKMMLDAKVIAYAKKCKVICFRDFHQEEDELYEVFLSDTFIKQSVPSSYCLKKLADYGSDSWLETLSGKARYDWRRRYGIENFPQCFNHKIIDNKQAVSQAQYQAWYQLYLNVQARSLEFSTHPIGFEFFKGLLALEGVIFIEVTEASDDQLVGFILAKSAGKLCDAILVGMDYDHKGKHLYHYLLMSMIKAVKSMGFKHLGMGITADREKKALGCVETKSYIFSCKPDTFEDEVVEYVAKTN